MEMLRRFDLRAILILEAWCRLLERITGRTNLFWFECLSGVYAISLSLYLWHAHELLALNVRIAGIALVTMAFIVSVFVTSHAKIAARERMCAGIENPAKVDMVHRYLRLILFFDSVSPIMCYGYFSFLHPDQMFLFGVMLFIAILVGTFALFWICAVLYACDPLPQSQNSALK